MALFLVARIGAEGVALAADAVASVVELDQVTPVPRAAAHVAGLCALRSRVLTVVDVHAALGLPRAADAPPATGTAVVCDVGGYGYALRLDRVDDVVEAGEPAPCPVALAANWRDAALGLLDVGGESLVVLDPARLVEGPPAGAEQR